MKLLKIEIKGKVQGVSFRVTAKRRASELGIVGFARNEDDNSVYIEAEGSNEALDAFTAWCQEGPLGAHVDSVKVSEHQASGRIGFTIH